MSRKNRKRKLQDEEQKTNDGEQDNFFPDEMRKEMETMWEIPQIFHFFYLTRESLSIPQLSIYEIERMLSIPRASKQLANVMTCLLSSPITKAKLRKVPPMPYEFWTNILAHKMASWFKVYYTKHKDPIKVLESIGIEPEFWNIFPDASLLKSRDFEDLSFKQRIWLLKTVCDTIMHTRKTVQEDIAKQAWEDQFETVLGVDRYGTRYIYFPQFIPNDLRIYRHCVDNKILSTVKPMRSKQEMEKTKIIETRSNKYKKEKLQSHNNLSVRRSNRHKRIDDKNLSNDKCNNDSATGSFISEDTNLSSTSTCSNNNNISLDTINRKRSRRLSKMSEESTLSNAKSSGYDTNTSSDKSVCDESTQMFKGFINSQDDNCSIGIINEMLHDLKSEIDEEKKVNKCGGNDSNELVLQENLVVELYTNTVDSCSETLAVERNENERLNDNLSSSSKTDDEKLNDIISAESSKLPEDIYLKSVSTSDNVSDISTTSKSDDEKLNETKTSDDNVSVNTNSLNKKVIFNRSYCALPIDSASLSEDVVRHERFSEEKVPSSIMKTRSNDFIHERKLRKRTKLRSRYKATQCNEELKTKAIRNGVKQVKMLEDIKTDEIDDKNYSASQTLLQEDIEDNLDDYTNDSDTSYNLRKPKDPKIDEYKKKFNQMLLDLSVSDFQLVVDSVERLRDLIASFSESKNTNNAKNTPMCQIKLVEKLTELLNSLEPIETTLKDTTRKAKSKLQREWSNFKEGSVEDQDSSSEGGLSSNWWILGSQGRDPLSTSGDTTLQTLPQSALSSFGAQNSQQQPQSVENEHENAVKNCSEQSCHEIQESIDERQDEDEEKQTDIETPPGRSQAEEEEEKRQHGKIESTSNNESTEKQQTRRVLRARGVSSYTEQFYSDDETEEDELEEWTDVEAIYAAPGTQIDTSTSHAASKDRYADNWSDQEDSDQDWILPGSRKRKNKRTSTNRRLKSFHHKLQSIKENTSQNDVASSVPHLDNAKIGKDKLKTKLKDDKEAGSTRIAESSSVSSDSTVASTSFATSNQNSKIPVPSMDTICKIESVNSVHSELDIKDEGPIYEFGSTNHYEITPNLQQNYCYMMPHNPGIAGGDIMTQGASLMQQTNVIQGYASQVHMQNYYVQPNYVMQNSQASFLPATHHQQQSIFQQQCPQMMSVQPSYVNNVGYVPYMVATTQHQATIVPPITKQQNPQNLIQCSPKLQNRYSQNNRHTMPRQNLSHPNDAVIRNNNTPTRGGYRRSKTKSIKSNVPQQRMPNPNTTSKQRASQTSSMKDSVQKTTSLIVISDSDDEIEMIITEKTTEKETLTNKTEAVSRKSVNQPKLKPTITSDITVASTKSVLPPQIIQRMSQGGISITPVKNTIPPPTTNNNTQLVVVVNETGNHYALSLPNGSKLILTPEQVAQIRASNGGKLIL